MKSYEKSIYIIVIIVLVAIIASGGTYIFMSSKNNNVNSEKKVNESNNSNNGNNKGGEKVVDGVKLINTKKGDNKIIQEYEIVLNGKKHAITLNYELEQLEEDIYSIVATYKGNELYHYANLNSELKCAVSFDVDFINNKFNEDNFIIIKGKDNKNYIAIYNFVKMEQNYGDTEYYIFNDDLEQINKNEKILIFYRGQSLIIGATDIEDFSTYDYGKMWYKDSFNLCYDKNYCQIRANIENDKIYALVMIPEITCENGTLEERIYTINNNKLEYEVINNYSFVSVQGSC